MNIITTFKKEQEDYSNQSYLGPVHLTYNPSYSACFFSRNNISLKKKKSANAVFPPEPNGSLVYIASRSFGCFVIYFNSSSTGLHFLSKASLNKTYSVIKIR
jgi:hypothetical protein